MAGLGQDNEDTSTGHLPIAYIKKELSLVFEVILMDLSTQTIEDLFYRQVKALTEQAKIRSFDTQFSDAWF